jgi:hypothetical protein
MVAANRCGQSQRRGKGRKPQGKGALLDHVGQAQFYWWKGEGEEKKVVTIEPTAASGEVAAGMHSEGTVAHAQEDTGEGYDGDQRWNDTWGRVAAVEQRRDRARTRGALCRRRQRGSGEEQRGCRGRRRGKKPGTDLQNLESSWVCL